MPEPVRSTPPPPEAPNRALHYVGLAVIVVVVIIMIAAI